jgi:16S rRNA (adenine1518-N6/adenine1519-N6)-dimethyltransferase
MSGAAAVHVDPETVRATLRAAGLRSRHALSQNFLADPDVLDAILAEADPPAGRRVLEIGPGLGLLTGGLLAAGAEVTAVELDRGLAAFLRERFEGVESLRLIEGDALDQDLVRLVEPPYDVVANLPYHITSPILHRLLGETRRPERLILMVQREVAERIAAPPGRMSYLSVFVQYHAKVRIAFTVPGAAFEPEPAVESAVIVVEPYPGDDRLPDAEAEDALKQMADPAFAVVPGKSVKKGDTWSKPSTLNLGPIGKYESTYKYTYEGKDEKDKNLEKIKVDTTLKYMPPDDAAAAGLPFKIVSAKLESKDPTGSIIFDSAKGRISSSTLGLKLDSAELQKNTAPLWGRTGHACRPRFVTWMTKETTPDCLSGIGRNST